MIGGNFPKLKKKKDKTSFQTLDYQPILARGIGPGWVSQGESNPATGFEAEFSLFLNFTYYINENSGINLSCFILW